MIVIETDSEAGEYLRRVLADPDTYKVSLAIHVQPEMSVAVKRNEGMWTAPLSVTHRVV